MIERDARSRAHLAPELGAVALLFLLLTLVACLMPAQTDTWWQLRAGEVMWQTRRIMLRDEFTHTVAGQYWPNHEWLSQVVFYALYRCGGLPLLTAFCALSVVAAWFIIYRLTAGPTTIRLILVGLGAALSTAGWSLRPQTLTFSFFAASLWILARQRFLWLLPPLFLIWANLHGAVAAGGVLIVAATGAAALTAHRRILPLMIIGTLCLLATAATPLGLSLWTEIPESLTRLKIYDVIEWRAPSLTNPADLPFWLILFGLAALAVRNHRRLRTLDSSTFILAAALTSILALRSTRNIALFLLCAVPAGSRLLALNNATTDSPGRTPPHEVPAAILAVTALLTTGVVAYAWTLPLSSLNWRPWNAQVFAAIAACEGPLYNRYDEGGEIIWFLRGRKVFLDSRQDPFPEDLVRAQLEVERSGDFQALFNRYGIRCALTDQRSGLSAALRKHGWHEQTTGTSLSVWTAPFAQ